MITFSFIGQDFLEVIFDFQLKKKMFQAIKNFDPREREKKIKKKERKEWELYQS